MTALRNHAQDRHLTGPQAPEDTDPEIARGNQSQALADGADRLPEVSNT